MKALGGCLAVNTHGLMDKNESKYNEFAFNNGLITTTNIPMNVIMPFLFGNNVFNTVADFMAHIRENVVTKDIKVKHIVNINKPNERFDGISI